LLRHRAGDEAALIEDVLTAVKCVEMRWPDSLDTLCCGCLGNIELLIEAGIALNRTGMKAEAIRRLVEIVMAARVSGDFRLGNRGSRFNLGLYKGIGGAAYTLLRQVRSGLPNVLLWE
jgi:lantibiotic modifying enzyme